MKTSNAEHAALGQLTTKIGSGATPRGGKESYLARGIPLIRSMNVYDLTFEGEGLAYLSDDQASELDHVTVQNDDVLGSGPIKGIPKGTMI